MSSLEGMTDEQIRNLASLSNDVLSDPATRREMQRIIKKRNPAAVIPELEVEDAVSKAASELKAENEALKAEVANDRLSRQRERIRDNLQDQYPTMTKYAIGSHESAAKFLHNERLLAQPAPEVPGKGGPMLMPSEAKEFFKSPTQVARRLAHAAVTDIMNARRNKAA
jgi:hypothetical protein